MVKKRWAVMALGAAIAFVLGASSMVAAGVVVTGQGNSLAVIKTVSKVSSQSTNSTDWVNVSGAVRRATATTNGTLFVGEFTAESICFAEEGLGGPEQPSGLEGFLETCLARIVVKDTAGSTVGIMNPADGEDFTFDSPIIVFGDGCCLVGVDQEGNAMERSITLGPGTYDFQVQFRVVDTSLLFNLDDWHFTLTRYNP